MTVTKKFKVFRISYPTFVTLCPWMQIDFHLQYRKMYSLRSLIIQLCQTLSVWMETAV